MIYLILISIFFNIVSACDSYSGSFVNEKGTLTMNWCFNEVNARDQIEMSVSMRASEYIAIGFGGSMYDADMIIGWMDESNNAMAYDYYSNSESEPQLDTSLGGSNDIEVVSGGYADGIMTITFKRYLKTGDSYDKEILKSGPNDMIYAWSSSDGLVQPKKAANIIKDIAYHDDNHNHISADFSKSDGIPSTLFGYEESGAMSRDLVASSYYGTLSTFQTVAAGSQDVYNVPFGSVADFADEEPSTGQPLVLLSDLERNVINMNSYPKLSLSISTLPNTTFELNHPEYFDVMTKPRTTLLGHLEEVSADELDQARQTYLTKHPESKAWITFSDFTMYRFIVEDVYVVGGFGNDHYIGWVGASQYLSIDLS